MKKLLSILGAVGLMATTGISVVACAPNDKKTDDTDDGDDTENGTEIKLQVDASTINIDQTLDIKIENYKQIKEILKDFTLRIDQQGTDADPILEKIGEFDQEAGKFVVKGLNQGTVKVTVQAYYQDKNLGHEPISKNLTITVIPAEAENIGITSDKTDLDLNDEDGERSKATIKIDDYEKVKTEWKDFILTITTLESAIEDTEILHQYGGFDEEKGEFKVWGSMPGKAKVSIFATAIDEAKNQNFANHTSTLTNEIIITVKKYDFESGLITEWKEWNVFGYGLTGNEFIKVLDERTRNLLKYGKDYEILNLNKEEKLKQDSVIEFKALESSKIVTGSGKLTLVNLDIWPLKEKIKSVEVGLSDQEFQEIVEKGMKSLSENAIYNKDYRTPDRPLFVGDKVKITAQEMPSKLLAGDVDIPVIGDSYINWDLNKLNEQAKSFIKTMNDLIKENEGSDYPEPIENPKLKEQWAKNYFEMHSFFARVFLETKYAVVNLDNEKIEIKEINEIKDYNQAKEKLEEKLDNNYQVGDNEEYASILSEYWRKFSFSR